MASRLKNEHPQQSQRTKSRGHYVSQACSFCRRRKSKCDGVKPICTPCLTSGRECSWGVGELAKRPSTKAYGESLRNRIIVLEHQVHRLETRLRRCHCSEAHIDLTPDVIDRTFDFTIPTHHSPQDDDPDDVYSVAGTNSDQDEIEQLCAPTEHLVLEERDLQQYGPTSIFRLAPKYMEREQHPTVLRLTTQEADERYVLKIEGSDRGLNEPTYEFDRYLPSDIKLSREEHDKVIDLLFKFITSWCLRIIPELFLRDMHRALSSTQSASNHNSPSADEQHQADTSSSHPLSSPLSSSSPPPTVKTPHYSPMLHNALIALALACSDDPWLRSDAVRDKFAGEAKKYIESECKKPNISVVQALSMIGTYHSSRGDQTIGYLYFGMSWRMAQALGLNVDCSPWVRGGIITPEDKSDRDWAYWTTFANDTDWSLYVGRDACISDQRGTIPLPMPDKELDRVLWEYPASNIQPQPSLLSETFVETCKLLSISRRIIAVVNSLSSHDGHHENNNYDIISTIDVELNTWKDNLPDRLEITPFSRDSALPHKLMLHLAYWWLFILLHRPFYRRLHMSDSDIDHAKLCNRAASHIMSLLSTYHSLYTLRYAPITLVQVTFAAGTVFLLSAVQSTSGTRRAPIALAHSLESAEQCVLYLEETGKAWGCANDVAGILKHLRDILIASAHRRGFANQYQLQHPHLQMQQQHLQQQHQHQQLQQQYQQQLRQHQQQQMQHLPPLVEKVESPEEYPMPLLSQASPSSSSTESHIRLMNSNGTQNSPYGTPPMLMTPSKSTGTSAADNGGNNNGMPYSPSRVNQYFVNSSPISRYGSMTSSGGGGGGGDGGPTSMSLSYGGGASNNTGGAPTGMGIMGMNDINWDGLDDVTFNNLFGSSSLATSAGVRSLSQPPGAGGVEYNFPVGMGMLGGEALGPQPVFPLQFSQQQMYEPSASAAAAGNDGNPGVSNNANAQQGYGNIQGMHNGRWAPA